MSLSGNTTRIGNEKYDQALYDMSEKTLSHAIIALQQGLAVPKRCLV